MSVWGGKNTGWYDSSLYVSTRLGQEEQGPDIWSNVTLSVSARVSRNEIGT